MKIINSTAADLEEIFNLYDSGTEYQKKVAEKHWIGFDSEMVLHEIEAKQQWKLMNGTQIAGIFCTTFDDPEIWQKKNADPAVYLHRIVTHPDYRGKNLIQQIISWAKDHAFTHHKKYIRMDTGSGNDKLNPALADFTLIVPLNAKTAGCSFKTFPSMEIAGIG